MSLVLSTAAWLLTGPAQAADRNPKIQQAIDRGVAYLRSKQNQNGFWPYNAFSATGGNIGATALVGFTLLECGVPPDDPMVRQAADYVRKNTPSLDFTYALSISIWFLDRLGEEADVPLIQLMAVRLLAGQSQAGGWIYSCPVVGNFQDQRLLVKLKTKDPEKKEGEGQKGRGGVEAKAEKKIPEVHPEIKEMLKQLDRGIAGPKGETPATGDNSNTQFAALALWVARRYGMPVEPTLIRIEKRYRVTQLQDGSWNYVPGFQGWANEHYSPAMTCAGLIGLAVGHGAAVQLAKEKRGVKVVDPDKDNNLQAGFRCLGSILQEYGQIRDPPGPADRGFYFLWSLERVAEIYGLKTIGRIDWYAWGANILFNSQDQEGAWKGRFHPSGMDTCFALLFLARANVAKDLSVTLRGKLRDPGTRTLKAGGVGADAIRKKEEKVSEASDKKSSTEKESPDTNPKSPPPQLANPKEKLAVPSATAEDQDRQTARKMSEELIAAKAPQQEELLGKYKEGKGLAYTLALANAIPRLSGDSKIKARDALAERFTRMTADTLRAELRQDDPEIRRAASLACAMKDDKSHIPDLIPLLDDPEPLVARAVHAALKSLTNQDFGPAKDASPKDRAQAIQAWKEWWSKQKQK